MIMAIFVTIEHGGTQLELNGSLPKNRRGTRERERKMIVKRREKERER